jgi:RNA polymerase sigma factor (sigma-70 family)
MNPENLYLANLPLIERIAASVAQRNQLTPAEAEQFLAHAKDKLVEDRYAIIGGFEGRCAFSTYLTTVITRMFFQYRVQLWGKWRPSMEARRLGDVAITLERMITRDGYTFAEAVEILSEHSRAVFSRAKLEAIYAKLSGHVAPISGSLKADGSADSSTVEGSYNSPNTRLRKRQVLTADLKVAFRDDVGLAVQRDRAAKIGRLLRAVIAGLDREDQAIMQLRFFDGLKVSQISAELGLDQRKLYRRIAMVLGVLRRALEEQFSAEEVAAIVAASDIDGQVAIPNVRTIKSADSPGIYVTPFTAGRTLVDLIRDSGKRDAGD